MTYLERDRAEGFGAGADRYDRLRPSYPPQLIADILTDTPTGPVRRVLDVGCGTGKVARLLRDAGRDVLGLEPDPRMAAVAADHGVTVEVGYLERWDPAGRVWDLLTAGQSWHWVDPTAGPTKALEVLRPGGRLAAFWNRPVHTPEMAAVLTDVYGRLAPELNQVSNVLGRGEGVARRAQPAAAALTAAGFIDVRVTPGDTYDRVVTHTPQSWVELAATHSDHAVLDPTVREPLLAELAGRLAELGPTLAVHLQTDLLVAIRP